MLCAFITDRINNGSNLVVQNSVYRHELRATQVLSAINMFFFYPNQSKTNFISILQGTDYSIIVNNYNFI